MRRVKKCEQCQRSFTSWSQTARYCSARCYTDSGTRGGPRAAVETAFCKWCGKPFERYANRKLKREICNRNCPARPPGVTSERLYFVWIAMKRRAAESKDPVCAAWAKKYEAFRAWALSSGYAPDSSLDAKTRELGIRPRIADGPRRAKYSTGRKNAKAHPARGSRAFHGARPAASGSCKLPRRACSTMPSSRPSAKRPAPTTKRLSNCSESLPAQISPGQNRADKGPVARNRIAS